MKRVKLLVVALAFTLLSGALLVPQVRALDREMRSAIVQRSVLVLPLRFNEQGALVDIPWSGSGTIISPGGLILTNYHVVAETGEWNALGIAVTTRADQAPQPAFRAEIVSASPALDLAVLQVTQLANGDPVEAENLNLPYVELGNADELVLGDELNVFGYPSAGGETITYTQGQVSGFNQQEGVEYPRAWIKTNTSISGGNSGGTAVDEAGKLVAVPTQLGSGSEGGSIVDCRPIQDTNGDGRLDGRDTCVPLGGFLNALRPVNLAYPLIQSAITGEPPENFGLDEPVTRPAPTSDGVVIYGYIVDADTGAPVPEAYFIVLRPGVTTRQFLAEQLTSQIAAVGVTEPDGYYELQPPLPRNALYSVVLLAEGYADIIEDNALEIGRDAPAFIQFDPITLSRR